jgi:hypothetical protein
MHEKHTIKTACTNGLPDDEYMMFETGVYYSGIKIFSHLPQNIKNLSWNVNKFKLALKRFLLMG